MPIIAKYKDNNVTVEKAYIRVGRIWGAKDEGWHCWVEVFAKKGDAETIVPTFSVSAPYVKGETPFIGLYAAIEDLPFIITKEEAKVEESPAQAAADKKPREKRKSKE